MLKRLAAVLLILLAASCNTNKVKTFKKSTELMYTTVSITVTARKAQEAESAIDAAFSEIKKLETLLNFWTRNSEIALINHDAGVQPVKVSPETLEIVRRALYISDKTGGAFDATIGPVVRLWNFKKQLRPTGEELEVALPLVDYKMVEVDPEASTVFLKDKRMSFDTGGIAKGFAADKAVEVLRKHGITGGLVAVAGDIRTFGTRANGRPWNLGIRDPRGEGPEDLIATIELHDEAISTSGDYERFFMEKGVRFHHLLDPKTGYPADRGSVSVTIIAPEAVLTDGLATGVFVMGPEKGLKLVEQLGLEAVIIDREGKRYTTPGLVERIQWKK
jgi:thiamine biosynthesis lipoprotein